MPQPYLRRLDPAAAALDSWTLPPTSGARAGYDGAERRRGSKAPAAVDTLGHLLAVAVTPADAQDRVGALCERVQAACGERVEVALVGPGYTGEPAREAGAAHGVRLEVVKHAEAKRGFVLLPRRWVVERSSGWLGRFRRLPETPAGLHFVASVALLLRQSAGLGILGP